MTELAARLTDSATTGVVIELTTEGLAAGFSPFFALSCSPNTDEGSEVITGGVGMKRDQIPLDYQSPDVRFAECKAAAQKIPALKAPGAIRLQTSITIRLILAAIGGPKRVA